MQSSLPGPEGLENEKKSKGMGRMTTCPANLLMMSFEMTPASSFCHKGQRKQKEGPSGKHTKLLVLPKMAFNSTSNASDISSANHLLGFSASLRIVINLQLKRWKLKLRIHGRNKSVLT